MAVDLFSFPVQPRSYHCGPLGIPLFWCCMLCMMAELMVLLRVGLQYRTEPKRIVQEEVLIRLLEAKVVASIASTQCARGPELYTLFCVT